MVFIHLLWCYTLTCKYKKRLFFYRYTHLRIGVRIVSGGFGRCLVPVGTNFSGDRDGRREVLQRHCQLFQYRTGQIASSVLRLLYGLRRSVLLAARLRRLHARWYVGILQDSYQSHLLRRRQQRLARAQGSNWQQQLLHREYRRCSIRRLLGHQIGQ